MKPKVNRQGHVHEDQGPTGQREGDSEILYSVYRLGSIIRNSRFWGVVIRASGNKYHSKPYDVIWWKPDKGWVRKVYASPPDHITHPISHNDASIPENVLAKATEIILRGGL